MSRACACSAPERVDPAENRDQPFSFLITTLQNYAGAGWYMRTDMRTHLRGPRGRISIDGSDRNVWRPKLSRALWAGDNSGCWHPCDAPGL
jgi:hypothetical protein